MKKQILNGFIVDGAIKNVDDIFQYLVGDNFIEDNCAASRERNSLQNDNAFNADNVSEKNNDQPDLPTLEKIERAKRNGLQRNLIQSLIIK